MRILVHSEDATYNPATKQWVFTLDRRISNPTRIVVQQCNYSASTATNYPLTVYVRSSGLTNLSRVKHTVELKGADHEDNSDTVVVLHQTNHANRYELDRPFSFPVHGHLPQQVIDFTFCDGRTPLDGRYTPAAVPGVSSAQIDAWCTAGNIVFWMDMDRDGAVLNESTGLQALADEDVGNVIARFPSDGSSTFTNSSAGGLTWKPFNANTSGITDQVGGAWESAVDSTTPNFTDPETGSFIMLWRSPDPLPALEIMWKSAGLELMLNSGSIQVRGQSGTYFPVVGGVLAGTDYIVKVNITKGAWTPAGFIVDYAIDLIKLSDNSVTSGTATNVRMRWTATSKHYSDAQSNMDGYYGMTFMTTQDATVDAAVVNYIKQVYSGEATEPVVDPDAVDASFQLELDIDTK